MNTGGLASEKTLRDEFAGQALTGLLSSPNLLSALIDESETDETPKPIAIKAYEMAESMLAEKARREAVVKQSLTTDHFGDANKMVELQAANRELVEALEACNAAFLKFAPQEESAYGAAWVKVRVTISKHKGAA